MIYVKMVLCILVMVLISGMLILSMLTLSGCTLSFQNISTHGTATDLVDENQSASPNVSPNIDIKPSLPGLGVPG